jgi:hypothetical protein
VNDARPAVALTEDLHVLPSDAGILPRYGPEWGVDAICGDGTVVASK